MLPPPLFCVGWSREKGDGSAAPKVWHILMVTSEEYFWFFAFWPDSQGPTYSNNETHIQADIESRFSLLDNSSARRSRDLKPPKPLDHESTLLWSEISEWSSLSYVDNLT